MAEEIEIKPIVTEDITEGRIDGNGTFDLLMQSITKHLEVEFGCNRITKDAYANVYLGSVQSAMSQSIAFLLQNQQSTAQANLLIKQGELIEIEKEKLELDKLLVQKQIAKMNEEILAIRQQVSLSKAEEQNVLTTNDRILAEIEIAKQQKINLISENNKLISEKALVDSNALLAQRNAEKVSQEILVAQENVKLTKQQVTNLGLEANNIPKLGSKLDAETSRTSQQTSNLIEDKKRTTQEIAKLVADTDLVTKNVENAVVTKTNLILSQDKIKNESKLLNHKANTELAQVKDTAYVVDSTGKMSTSSFNITGIIGKQKDLYTAQKDGFKRDAEQKLAKIMVDSWSVRNSADPEGNSANSVNKLFDDTIGQVIAKAQAGIQ